MTGEKKRSFGLSIMGRLLLPIVACILVSFIATTVFWVTKQSNTLIKAFESELALSQIFVAPPVAAAVWDFNTDGAAGAIAGVTQMENALFAKVFVDGEQFAEVSVEGADQTGWEEGIAEILAMEEAEARFEAKQGAYWKFPIHHNDGPVVGEMVMGL